MFESAFPILAIREIQLVIPVLVQIAWLHRLVYRFIVHQMIDKAGFVGLDGVLGKVYCAVAFRIHSFWVLFRLSATGFIWC